MKYSLIIPVYRNEGSLQELLAALDAMSTSLDGQLEVVFVVDGSPDGCHAMLSQASPALRFPTRLIAHSRNFGSFAAIRTGLAEADSDYFAVMAADLQEPPELVLNFFRMLDTDECDVVVGTRSSREDPWFTRMSSGLFWEIYRRLVVKEMPVGGVDVFGCNRLFRDKLLELAESRSSLVALIFWLGFRRSAVGYDRRPRTTGSSAWTLGKKLDYMADSVFAFTDYPIRIMLRLGLVGSCLFILTAAVILAARLLGAIEVPGYAAIMLAVLVVGAVNVTCLGLVGSYAWRAYENTKRRPVSVVASRLVANGRNDDDTTKAAGDQ